MYNLRLLNLWFIFTVCLKVLFCEALSTPSSIIVNKIEKGFSEVMPSKLLTANNSGEISPTSEEEEGKKLGDQCSYLYDCINVKAICYFGVCTCPPGYYKYYSPVYQESVCRQKKRFNETCIKDDDCRFHDANSLCILRRCRCTQRTRFMKLQNSEGKCYTFGLQRGYRCEIDEQCLVSDGYKCKCSDFCHCTIIENNDNSIRIENILIGVFACMAILIGIQLIILFLRKRFKASQQPEQLQLNLEELGDPVCSVASAPMEEASSPIPGQTVPHSNHHAASISESFDLPPSYDEVCKNDKKSLDHVTSPF